MELLEGSYSEDLTSQEFQILMPRTPIKSLGAILHDINDGAVHEY